MALEDEIKSLEMKVIERKNELSKFSENIPDEIKN
ncbi:hypothetical protein SAMN04487752_0317, partial [Carnobacterium viridans]